MTEHQIQTVAVTWLRIKFPRLIIYAVPNGGFRNPREAVKLKAEGVLAGVPDLHIPHARNGYHSLYVEVKSAEGVVSKKQKEIHKQLRETDNMVVVCRTVLQIKRAVVDYYAPQELENLEKTGC